MQDYPNIEFVIFDGNSTDGTLEVLRAHDADITFWASEPDKGRNDAFNKALAMATGDYLTAVMADDWLEPGFVSATIAAFQRLQTDYVFGDRMLYDENSTFLYRIAGDPDFARKLPYWMSLNSPSFSIRRDMLDKIGLFTDITVASDYDFFLRAHRAGYRGAYDSAILYHFLTGGISTFRVFQGYRDNLNLALKHGAPRIPAYLAYASNLSRHGLREALGKILLPQALLGLRRLRHKLKGARS